MARVYQIFQPRTGSLLAAGTGPAWLALPLPCLWAFRHGLWGRGLLLLVIDALLALFVPSLLATQPVAISLALLAPRVVTLLRGNEWWVAALEDRGHEYLGRIVARNGADAVAQVARRGSMIPPELKPRTAVTGFRFPPTSVQQLWAVARLTIGAAFRYRLVVVLMSLLLGVVVVLPSIIKHDETAQGFTQILLTYTLGIITALLSMVTLWLACGTLARDIDECQMQVVASKPVPRWQIWAGKWIGILLLNTMLLSMSAGAVYLLMMWRATQLPAALQQSLRSNVLTARASLKDAPTDYEAKAEAFVRSKLPELQAKNVNLAEFRKQAKEMIKARDELVPPDHFRRYRLKAGSAAESLTTRPIFVRVKFHTPELGAKRPYEIQVDAGPPDTAQRRTTGRSLAAEASHEIELPPVILDAEGYLVVDVANRSDAPLLFPSDEGFEVLYQEGGFGLNYVRALVVILCWLGLLAAIGLSAASFLSFPVASFLATTVLILGLSTGTLKTVVEDNTVFGRDHDSNLPAHPVLDSMFVPFFQFLLDTVNLVHQFAPIDSVSSGRSITWGAVAQAIAVVVLGLGGIFAAVGIISFTRRELATAQSFH